MLVLSRKIGQSLLIGNDIRIKVVEIRGQQVRLGLEAPDDVPVVREELHREVADNNLRATAADPAAVADLAARLRRHAPRGGSSNGDDR
ncbi:MAG: carbon storage regulator CsrA [Acidobacteria bacterium]|jgi:carbon storage regulator|nr:carbon storage regulator CsrA [Acidobacteriota bacterium]